MKRPRFTIAEITLFVLVVAIGLAAIRSGSDAWAGGILSVTYFTLFCSLLGIAFGRKSRRVYWLGFAMLGWAYLALLLWPGPDGHIGDALLAPNMFVYVCDIVHPAPFGGGSAHFAAMSARANVIRIGTALEALLWAFFGGWAARYFASGPEGALGQGPSNHAEKP